MLISELRHMGPAAALLASAFLWTAPALGSTPPTHSTKHQLTSTTSIADTAGTGREKRQRVAAVTPPPASSDDVFAQLGLMSWQTYLLLLQLPIVAFLAISTLQARRAFHQEGFLFVSLGWFANFLYITTNHIATLVPGPLIAGPVLLDKVASVFDILTGLCFWIAYEAARPRRWTKRPLTLITIGFVALLAYASSFYVIAAERNAAVAALPFVVGAMFGIGCLVSFYTTLRPSEHSRQEYLLLGGLWIYFLIQPLYLVATLWSPTMAWGFTGGLIAKVCIAFGTIGYLVSAAAAGVRAEEQRAHIEDLTNTIGRILHEIATPVSQIAVHSTRLISVAPRGAFHSHLSSLENARLRLAATLEAARRLLPYPDTLINLRDVASTFHGIPRFNEEQVISANTLAQLALMAVKETRAEKVKIFTTYSADCCLRCAPIDITQVVINLLRNAYDAMPNGVGVVRLETHNRERAGEPIIEIVVQDDGEGIAPNRQADVFRQGVTTRGEAIGRGYGLAVVKELTEKNYGSIALKSPATTSAERPGLIMTLTFPRVSCKRGQK
jgi:signal transduction histidine kinase